MEIDLRSLRERLARFDGPRRAAKPTQAARGGDAEAMLQLGCEAVGSGHWLRREARELCLERGEGAHQLLPVRPGLPDGTWAIIDTETTGLESGAGTVVFLVAILRVDESGAELRQHFLSELCGEASLLAAVSDDLQGCSLLISYNGKSFDLPRLRSRMVLHRQPSQALAADHVDLVHWMRRLGRGWLEDARLATVERELLDIHRVADIPGAQVPVVYREWLQRGVTSDLEAVMQHNRLDVLHLATLWNRLAELMSQPRQDGLPAPLRLALGRQLELRFRMNDAAHCYSRAAEEGEASCRRSALWRQARLLRRAGDFDSARGIWELLSLEQPAWLPPRLELAKLFEHRLRDLRAARMQTEEALKILAADSLSSPRRRREERASLLHRLQRIQRKAERGSIA